MASTLLMGILNVTPDSFSDGGQFLDPQAAVQRALGMEMEGASIIDIGGESTRPGAKPISEPDEWARLSPVLDELEGLQIPLSIDTRRPGIAERVLQRGVRFINHVAEEGETHTVQRMADLVRGTPATLILMHVRGRIESMHKLPPMRDVVGETLAGLRDLRDIALHAGLPQNQLWLDPGIGFGKNGDENFQLMRGLRALHELGCRLIVGPSRKRFLATSGDSAADRDFATAVAVAAAVAARCHAVRVHNIAAMWQVVRASEKLFLT